MVDYTDSTQNLAINLETIGEGKLTTTKITAKDIEVYPIANDVSAVEGEGIRVVINTINDGVEDDVFCSLTNDNTQEIIHTFESHALAGAHINFTFSELWITMPTGDLNLKIDVGHIE